MKLNYLPELVTLLLLVFINPSFSAPTKVDGMYVNTFGNPSNQALIFVHGGPGYNSWDFEVTTAQALADQGYFVVVYDQRGQGRSEKAESAAYNYKQYADDLKSILDSLHLVKPVLLGHSHGGPIAIKFDEYYPGVAKSVVLVSAPVDFFGSIQGALNNCAERYKSTGQDGKLSQLAFVYGQLTLVPDLSFDELINSIVTAFYFAGDCGLYQVKNPTPDNLRLMGLLKANPIKGPVSGQTEAVPGFQKNENYIHFNGLEWVYANREHYCGIYGDEDGLFTPIELALIKNVIQPSGEPQRLKIIQGASHAVYINQQDEFFKALKTTCGI